MADTKLETPKDLALYLAKLLDKAIKRGGEKTKTEVLANLEQFEKEDSEYGY